MRFLIVGLQRSGTTVISELLSGHPEVCMFSDELKVTPLFSKGIRTYGMGNETENDVKIGFQAIFDTITRTNKNVSTWGAKIALQEPKDAKILISCLNQNFENIKIIYINRTDSIARIGSLLNARKTKIYHSTDAPKKFKNKKITISKKTFRKYFLKELKIKEILHFNKKHTVININYENDILTKRFKHTVFRDLGLPIIKPDWQYLKKISLNPEDYINNINYLIKYKHNLESNYSNNRISYKPSFIEKKKMIIKHYLNI